MKSLFHISTISIGLVATNFCLAYISNPSTSSVGSPTANASAYSASNLTVTGAIWADYETKFVGNKTSHGATINRAQLGFQYQFDSIWEAHAVFKADSTGALQTDTAFVRRNSENGFTELGLINDPYIKWLDEASGTRWIYKSLTQYSAFRSDKALAINGVSNSSGGTVAFTLKNGADDAISQFANRDKSSLLSAAYKTPLNDSLNGNIYVQYQTKDADAVAISAQTASLGLGAALAGGVDAFKFLGEFAFSKVQTDSATAVIGFGITAKYMFTEGKSFYARYYSGNEAWKSKQSLKDDFEFGIVRDYSKNVNYGAFAEFMNITPDLSTTVRLRVATKF